MPIDRELAPRSAGSFDIREFFDAGTSGQIRNTLGNSRLSRKVWESASGYGCALDETAPGESACAFIRFFHHDARRVSIGVSGRFRLDSCPAGGWLLVPLSPGEPAFWVPQMPVLRALDKDGHILTEKPVEILAVHAASNLLSVEFNILAGLHLDLVIWKIAPRDGFLNALTNLSSIERQAVFLWGSHSSYRQPADVYLHLVFGHVYESRFAWPHNRKICSENDAHALYVTLCGLEQATGKKFYALLKDQLLLSVLARQSSDGGWHHGEWSDGMEAHLRLNGSAIHLLLDSLEERHNESIRQALERAVDFITRHKDNLTAGTWFLHDGLETSVESAKQLPFRWTSSRAFGKSVSNMLVLNTHLDITILLDRYGQLTGDCRHAQLVQSAREATRLVLQSRPLEALYRILFVLIGWTLLPTSIARKLPLPARALKRLAWKWLIPSLHRIKAFFPRLVMPGGYIDRALVLEGLADDYHSINLMDLARYWRRFPEEGLVCIVEDGLSFVHSRPTAEYWAQRQERKYALGFLAEALYHFYTLNPKKIYRDWLGATILKLEDEQLGLPPSLLGGNAEAVRRHRQIPCPRLTDGRLRVANLASEERADFLIVNPTTEPLPLLWEHNAFPEIAWETPGNQFVKGEGVMVPARGWLHGSIQVQAKYPCASGL